MKQIANYATPFQRITEADRWEVIRIDSDYQEEIVIQTLSSTEPFQRRLAWWQWRKRFNNWFSGFVVSSNN